MATSRSKDHRKYIIALERIDDTLERTDLPASIAGDNSDAVATTSIDSQLSRLSTRNTLLKALNSITVQLVNRTELTPLLQHIAIEIKQLFKADIVQINMLHESGNYLQTVCTAGDWLNGRRYRYGEGANGMAWKTRSVQIIEDYQCYAQKLDGLEDVQRCAVVPIFKDDNLSLIHI